MRGEWQLWRRDRARAIGIAAMLLLAVAVPPAQARQLDLDGPPAAEAGLPAVGARLRDAAPLGPFPVPLPPGEWQVYFAERTEADGGATVTRKLGLLALDGDAMVQEVYARADLQRDGRGFQAFPWCRDPAYFHQQQRANTHTRDQDCWHVRAESLVERDDAGPRFQALYAKADAENLFLPAATVGSRFHFAGPDALLRVSYAWNPDLVLRARTQEKVWLAADWSKGEVSRDPRRLAVMRIMQDWGEGWYERVRTAFETGAAAQK